MISSVARVAFGLSLVVALPLVAAAKDKVRLVDSQATIFAHYAIYQAQSEGYYDAEDLDVSIIVGRGGADSLQAVVTGSQDMIFGTGILGVIGAYAKGAPVTIVASAVRGAKETIWLVKQDSPLKTLKDLDGKDFAYSAPGSLTHLVTQTLVRELGIKPKLVSTGNMSASRTQMMSGQTDTAWAGFPGGLDLVRAGEARILGTADHPKINELSMRVIAAHSGWLAKNREVATRMMRAIWKGQQFNMSGEKAVARWAEHWKYAPEDAKDVYRYNAIDDLRFAPLGGLDIILALAKEHDYIKEALTEQEKKGLVTIVYDPGK
jgi:NitT/TauT family transport system substrate-binding protein